MEIGIVKVAPARYSCKNNIPTPGHLTCSTTRTGMCFWLLVRKRTRENRASALFSVAVAQSNRTTFRWVVKMQMAGVHCRCGIISPNRQSWNKFSDIWALFIFWVLTRPILSRKSWICNSVVYIYIVYICATLLLRVLKLRRHCFRNLQHCK